MDVFLFVCLIESILFIEKSDFRNKYNIINKTNISL